MKIDIAKFAIKNKPIAITGINPRNIQATLPPVINAMMDEKMIMRAAGHSNFKTTMTYYDNPTRAHQREVMKAKMAATAIGHSATTTPLVTTIMEMVSGLSKDQQALLAGKLNAFLENGADNSKQLTVSA